MPTINQQEPVQQTSAISGQSLKLALLVLAVLYFMLGFITVLNDTLVPFFKHGFNLNYSQSSLVQFYFYLTYGLISIPLGKLVDRIGYKKGMVFGFLVAAIGACLFFPAAIYHKYYLFLAALFVIAIGIVGLQVSANPYITALGPAKSAASRLTLIQGIGSLGTTLAPLFGAHFILSKISPDESSSSALIQPYLIIASGLALIGIIIYFMKLPDVRGSVSAHQETEKTSLLSLIQNHPNLKFGILAIFMYVGAEVAIGTYLTNYIADRLAISESQANYYLSFYWGGMLVGRFVGSQFLKKYKSNLILKLVSLGAVLFIILSLITSGNLSIWLMILVGVCNSIMFATIFSLSVFGLGNQTGSGSGLLSTAIVGGAAITYLQGTLKDAFHWEIAFILPVLCYVIIWAYAYFIGKKYSI